MVTQQEIQQAQQQLQQRRTEIEKAQRELVQFNPREAEQRALRSFRSQGRMSPSLQRLQRKESQEEGFRTVRELQGEVEKAFAEQQELERDFESQRGIIESQSRIQSVVESALRTGRASGFSDLNREERAIANEIIKRAEDSADRAAKRLSSRGLTFDNSGRLRELSPEAKKFFDRIASSNLADTQGVQSLQTGEILLKSGSILDPRTQTISTRIASMAPQELLNQQTFSTKGIPGVNMTPFTEQINFKDAILPFVGSPEVAKDRVISFLDKGIINNPNLLTINTGIPGAGSITFEDISKVALSEKTPGFIRNPASAIPTTIGDVLSSKTPKFIGSVVQEGVIGAAELVGVPTITKKIEVPDRRFYERGTAFSSGNLFILPEETGTETKEFTVISPRTIGNIAGGTATGATYLVPYLGTSIIASDTGRAINQLRNVPEKVKVEDYRPTGFSSSEWKSYLNSQEGKELKEQVKSYNKEIDQFKKQTYLGIGLGVVGAAAPFAIKGLRTGFTPRDRIITRSESSSFQSGVVNQMEDSSYGKFLTEISTSPTIAERYKPIPKFFGAKSEIITVTPSRMDEITTFFVEEGGRVSSLSSSKRLGAKDPMQSYFTGGEKIKEVSFLDKKSLSPIELNLQRDLGPQFTISGIEPSNYISKGGFFRGARIPSGEGIPILKLRETRARGEVRGIFQVGGTPVTTRTISASRVTPIGKIGDVQVFDTLASTRSFRSINPRVKGNNIIVPGRVMVRQIPKQSSEGVNFIRRGTGNKAIRSLSSQETIARVIQQIPSTRSRSSLSNANAATRRAQKAFQKQFDSYLTAPRMVGGLGKSTSVFYGKGSLASNEDIITPTMSSFIRSPQVPLNSKFIATNKLQNLALRVSPSQAIGVSPSESLKVSQLPRVKLSERLVPSTSSSVFTGTRSSVRLGSSVSQVPKINLRTSQSLRERVDMRIPNPVININPPIITIKTPKIPKIKLPKSEIAKNKRRSRRVPNDFIPEIRRFRRWIPLGRFKSLEEASGKAIRRARTGLGVSIRVKKGEQVVPIKADTRFFEPSKRESGVLIQRRGTRLSTRQEVSEILSSRKAGGIKFFR